MRTRTKLSILAVVLLLAILGAGLWAGNFFYDLALNPRVDKSKVFKAQHNALNFAEERMLSMRRDADWIRENGGENWETTSIDGLRLHATALMGDAPEDSWVLICHGYNGDGTQMATSARRFFGKGYNILLPDARGCGKSEGGYFGMGWHDRFDVIAWLNRINATHSPKNIFLYGVSMGGATVMMTSGEKLPDNIRAIVEDCGYSSAHDEFAYQLKKMYGLPAFPLMNFASLVTRIRAGYWLEEASAMKQVAKSVTPMLFIHGADDTFVPIEMLARVYDSAKCAKEKLVIEKAGHAGSSVAEPDIYWGAVDTFMEKYKQ